MTEIMVTTSEITSADRRDHRLARLGWDRMGHKVAPGLYRLGMPTFDSPVFVTCNYSLSFDALRSSLGDMDAYVMVLDTKGINVWCAAGKGTFGTEEVIRRIEETGLKEVVKHRVVILPQLGAPGVNANEVRRRSGFKVEYGPVLASDIKEYMKAGVATAEMRRVRFPLRDRMVLVPVEIVNYLRYWLPATLLLLLFGGLVGGLAVLIFGIFGLVLFPMLLPYLPTREFSSKGLILGVIGGLLFVLLQMQFGGLALNFQGMIAAIAEVLLMAAPIAYVALNFTGSSPIASRTGVRREIFRYIPIFVIMLAVGAVLIAIAALVPFGGSL
ncbi:MAG: carbon monoxide dehydrogenase [Methanomassiliicoccales archaeon]|nr:carbon monoxide dehydrogenase [Methanomassiliicoccales archaeon]